LRIACSAIRTALRFRHISRPHDTTFPSGVFGVCLSLFPVARAYAATLSIQPEAGIVSMHKQRDDIWVEYYLPSNNDYREEFTTPAFGVALRLDTSRVVFQLGWRNLGNVHINNAGLVLDDDYWKFLRHQAPAPATIERMDSTGNEQQVFAEAGFKFHLGRYDLIPSVGISEERIRWHAVASFPHAFLHGQKPQVFTSLPQNHPAPFAGLTLQHDELGVGLYYLVTDPMRNLGIDPLYPGQGPSAIYLRISYAFRLIK